MNTDASPPTLADEDVALLALLARGRSGRELSDALGVNPRTVQRRITRIRAELGADTTMQAVVIAVRAGVI